MNERRIVRDEKALLELLVEGDITGLECALGLDSGEFGRIMRGEPGVDEVEEDEFYDDEEDWLPRPEWLHPDCRNVCSALDLGTCCKYPDNPLVRVAVDLADSANLALGGLGEVSCAQSGAALARCFRMIPGLLAQIHAMLPRLNGAARAQLLCPVGTLAGALDQACGDGGPWGCGDPGVPDRRADFSPMIELVAECSVAIRTALGWPGGPARDPVVVRPRQPRG